MDHKSFSDTNEMMQSSEIMVKYTNEDPHKSSNKRHHIDSFNDDKITDHMKLDLPLSSVIDDSKFPSSNAQYANSRISKSSYSDEEGSDTEIDNLRWKHLYQQDKYQPMSDDYSESSDSIHDRQKLKTMKVSFNHKSRQKNMSHDRMRHKIDIDEVEGKFNDHHKNTGRMRKHENANQTLNINGAGNQSSTYSHS
jgi:hypothetical protein